MTLTREQVVQWAREAGLSIECRNSIDGDEVVQEAYWRIITDEVERLATLAFNAGRERGLGEAVEVCKANAKRWPDLRGFYVANECAAAIEQLRGK